LLKRVFLIFIIGFLGFLALAVVNPSLFINKPLIKKATAKFIPELKIDWNNINFQLDSRSLFRKEILVELKDGCIDYQKYKACFENFKVVLGLSLSKLKLLYISELIAIDKEIRVVLPESENSDKPTNYAELITTLNNQVNKWSRLQPEKLKVSLNNTQIIKGAEKYEVVFAIDKKIKFSLINSGINVKGFVNDLDDDGKSDGDIVFENESLKVQSKFTITKKNTILIRLDNTIESKKSEEVRNILASPIVKISANLNYENKILTLSLDPAKIKFKKYFTSLSLDNCSISLDLNTTKIPTEVKCPEIKLSLDFYSLLSDQKIMKNIKNQKIDFDLNLHGNLLLQPENLDQSKIGEFKFQGKNIRRNNFQFNLLYDANIINNEGSMSLSANESSLILEVPDVSYLFNIFENTPFAVPAPLNSLAGSLKLKTKEANNFKIPFDVEMNLDKSKYNKLKLTAEGGVLLPEKKSDKTKVNLAILLKQLHLYLPKIDPIKGIPSLGSTNIQKNFTNKKSTEKPNVIFDLSLKSESDSTVRLYYYLFDPYLDFGVESNYGVKDGFKVYKKSSNTKLKYLKRTVYVDNIKIENKPKSKSTFINSTFSYKQAGYNIKLKVIGTSEDPELLLSSEPSLPRQDIISLLIYSRKTSQISSFNKESVGGAEAAIADRTLGLFSIWAFASTPIETISYDPARKTYSAQVALPGDIKFTIGTDWEKVNSLQFYKRLGDSWLLVTSYEPDEIREDKGNFLLQKEINY